MSNVRYDILFAFNLNILFVDNAMYVSFINNAFNHLQLPLGEHATNKYCSFSICLGRRFLNECIYIHRKCNQSKIQTPSTKDI